MIPEPRVSIAGVAELSAEEVRACGDPLTASASAVARAAVDAGIGLERIDALLSYDSLVSPDLMQASRVAEYLGIAPCYASLIGSAGASPAFASIVASSMIKAGLARTVAVAHSDLRSSAAPRTRVIRRLASMVGNPQFEDPFGPTVPTLYALLAGWLIQTGAAARDDLAAIAVQTRAWAGLNPNARMREALTLAEVIGAPPIAGPLGRHDCCLITDFAGALIITAEKSERPRVEVIAAAGSASHEEILQMDPSDPLAPVRGVAQRLYRDAGLGPHDIDVALLYDSFTVTVALQLLAYDLHEGGKLSALLGGVGIGPGGRLPVNTHGGLLSATTSGIFHVVEAVRQLRGEAGERQVPGASTALVTNVGGVFSNHCALALRGEL